MLWQVPSNNENTLWVFGTHSASRPCTTQFMLEMKHSSEQNWLSVTYDGHCIATCSVFRSVMTAPKRVKSFSSDFHYSSQMSWDWMARATIKADINRYEKLCGNKPCPTCHNAHPSLWHYGHTLHCKKNPDLKGFIGCVCPPSPPFPLRPKVPRISLSLFV